MATSYIVIKKDAYFIYSPLQPDVYNYRVRGTGPLPRNSSSNPPEFPKRGLTPAYPYQPHYKVWVKVACLKESFAFPPAHVTEKIQFDPFGIKLACVILAPFF